MKGKLVKLAIRARDITPLALAGVVAFYFGDITWGAFCAGILIAMIYEILERDKNCTHRGRVYARAVTLLSALALSGPVAMALMKLSKEGTALLLLSMGMTVAFDVFSMVGGMLLAWGGGHNITPTESPNKTWEGLVAGTTLCLVSGLFAVRYIEQDYVKISMPGPMLYIMLFTMPIVAFFGDLNESMVKRRLFVFNPRSLGHSHNRMVCIKDYSRLLWSHGGFCDRFDGQTAVATYVGLFYLISTVLPR